MCRRTSFAWQAWHFMAWTFAFCTYATGLALVARLGGLGSVCRRASFAWQAWHFVASTFTLCGRRDASWHPSSLCVAGPLLRGRRGTSGMDLHFLHLRHWAGSGGALGRLGFQWSPRVSCVPGVALRDIHLHFAWQAWHFVASTFTLCGRRGTYGTGLALVARLGGLGSSGRCTSRACQAWHFVTSTFTLCGRRGTSWHPPSLCVAGVALTALGWLWWRALGGLGSSGRRTSFAWQAWHFVTSTFTLCGRRGTSWHRPSLCVASVALRDIDLHFVWQAWHLVTSTFTLRGRRGTW